MMINKDKIIVNSWNEWDPLKHVIVGVADGVHIPPPEPALDAKVPEDSDMKGQWGPRSEETKRRNSEAMKRRWADPDSRKKLINSKI